ncbi:alkyl hydroperoxide reductase AhpD [Sphaerisporangium melleum]|uniref:Alkyl hydroperoxide reductase AhpD n=1 Tax=Sphaerisporangium melleum TaxID=321316 RepID=A0A917QX78_9ACTN|nr:carboxymuconolactone decarboxylase family protein [Sphaerisporangium melleum]GGK73777.1 alkyl hydroperoxide reductase AhpD [Sphaerisporangium melleum]GII70828.1 alkyl hydroperoxide reductase AhpD [Sphaerisporangium melleum]
MTTNTTERAQSRVNLKKQTPEIYKALIELDGLVAASGLPAPLLELVRIRASQINGCAYCVDIHTIDARAGGEREQRIYALPVWRETPFFTGRERAALELTEAVTLLPQSGVGDEVYERAARHFSDEELAKLVWAIIVINSWNRIGVTSRLEPGGYHPSAS